MAVPRAFIFALVISCAACFAPPACAARPLAQLARASMQPLGLVMGPKGKGGKAEAAEEPKKQYTGLTFFGLPASAFISWGKPQQNWVTGKKMPLKRSRWLIKPGDK